MIVNFRIRKINRGTCKLVRIPILIIIKKDKKYGACSSRKLIKNGVRKSLHYELL